MEQNGDMEIDQDRDVDATTPFRTRKPAEQVLRLLPSNGIVPGAPIVKAQSPPEPSVIMPDIMEIDNPPMVASVGVVDYLSPDYNTQYSSRGRGLIIMNMQCYDDDERRPRKGSERDAEALKKVFIELKFEPIRVSHDQNVEPEFIHKDLNREQIKELVRKATDPSLNDYTNSDCFMCAVLTYGIEGAIMTCEENGDELMDVNEIIEPFLGSNCKSLVMKPKIFFIQSCPPYEKTMADSHATDAEVFDNRRAYRMALPTHADVLVQFCGLPGMYGWIRNRRRGLSWYMECLVKALEKFCVERMQRGSRKSVEFSAIMTRVNKMIEDIIDKEGLGLSEEFGIPTVKSTLTKNLFFYPKENAVQAQDDSAPYNAGGVNPQSN